MTRRGGGLAPRRSLLAAGLLGIAVLGIAGSRVLPGDGLAAVHRMAAFIRGAGVAGPALFAALAVLAALSGAVPASLVAVAAGAVYGQVPGFLLMAASLMTGGTAAFGLSRSVFRPSIERLVARRARWHGIDAALARQGWKFVGLLRLSPAMPFSATSYLLGLSSVSLPGYLAGTLAALLPLFLYVFCGTLTDAGLAAWVDGSGPFRWIPLGLGAAATLALIVFLGRLVRHRQLPMQPIGGGPGGGE